MEIIPFLIFVFIAFKVFTSFSKAASSEQGKTAKEMMRQLNAQMQQASKGQGRSSGMDGYEENVRTTQGRQRISKKGPTARGRARLAERGSTANGRERLAMRNQSSSPWGHEHDLGGNDAPSSPGARVAANYLKKAKTKRVASHKNEEQYGRRGMNMDQNKNRTDSWGERGDSGFLNGTTLVILLVIGAGVLYVLSNLPAA